MSKKEIVGQRVEASLSNVPRGWVVYKAFSMSAVAVYGGGSVKSLGSNSNAGGDDGRGSETVASFRS